MLLRVVPELHAVAEAERAGVRARLAREDPEEARLPGAVQAHHEEPLPPLHVEGDVLEDRGVRRSPS